MNEVVYNDKYGGFGLSPEAIKRYCELSNKDIQTVDECSIERHDPILVQVVRELGDKANANYADLKIFKIPGCEYIIDEYDGWETVEYPEKKKDWLLIDTKENREIYPEKFL